MEIKRLIEQLALENAVHHEGKAQPGSVIAKVIGSMPELKTTIKEWSKHVGSIVSMVNKMTVFEQTEKLKAIAPELLEKKKHEKRDELRPLPNADPGKPGKVVLRFEPSPSGLLHIGHCFSLLLNSEYAKMYKGRLILRISDTNPDNVLPEAYALHEEAAQWVTENTIHDVVIQSDRMESYYRAGLTLIEEGHAYVCECSQEEFKQWSAKMMACACRNLGKDTMVKRWQRLFKREDEGGYLEGDAVVRLKTDMRHKNPAMRDFPLLRICENEHPRQGSKYRVWPLMNLAVAVDDHELGITHVIRGKDHMDNTKRQTFLYDCMKWVQPFSYHIGRVKFEGLVLSKTKTKEAIDEGRFTGWDDIRLPILLVLRRRGYQPQSLVKLVRSMGVTEVDKRVEAGEFFKSLNFFNREIVEPIANRYFFVENPKEITIAKAPKQSLNLDLHPDLRKGGRPFSTSKSFYLSPHDLDQIQEGKLYRLMHCLNVIQKKGKFMCDSLDQETYSKLGAGIFHWLPADETGGSKSKGDKNGKGDKKGNGEMLAKVKLIMDDGSARIGLGEPALKNITMGDIVQFERIAFARYDHDEDDVKVFWYLHR